MLKKHQYINWIVFSAIRLLYSTFPDLHLGVQIKFLFLQDGMFISVTVDGEFPSTRVPKQGFYGHWSRAVTTRRRKIVAASGMLCLSHAEAAVLAGGPQSAV